MNKNFSKHLLVFTILLPGLYVSGKEISFKVSQEKKNIIEVPNRHHENVAATTRAIVDDTETYEVTINLLNDREDWSLRNFSACTAGKDPVQISSYERIFNLEAGVYDIIGFFTHENTCSGYIVCENIEVNENMTVDINTATLKNHIEFRPVLPDGSFLELPFVKFDDEGNETIVSEGSMPFSNLTTIAHIAGGGWGMTEFSFESPNIEESPWGFYDPSKKWEIYVNDVSEQIEFGIAAWIGTPEYDLASQLFMMASQHGSKSGVISNDKDTFVAREFDPAWTLAGEDTENLLSEAYVNPYGFATAVLIDDCQMHPTSYVSTTSTSENIYKLAFSNNNPLNASVHIIVAPMKCELLKIDTRLYMATNMGPWLRPFESGEWEIFPNASLAFTPDKDTSVYSYGSIEQFSTTFDKNEDVMFGTVPLVSAVVKREYNPYTGDEIMGFDISATGRIGEIRNTDAIVMDAELSVNGVKVAGSMDEIYNWLDEYTSEEAGEAVLKLTGNYSAKAKA